MSKKPGIYRVIYNLPGSIGFCSQQFIYEKECETSLTDIAKKHAVKKESERYNVEKSKIHIMNIEYVRYISDEQKTLAKDI